MSSEDFNNSCSTCAPSPTAVCHLNYTSRKGNYRGWKGQPKFRCWEGKSSELLWAAGCGLGGLWEAGPGARGKATG